MTRHGALCALVTAAALSGCASTSGWRPTVDTYNDPRAQHVAQDEAECRQLALQASGGTANEAASGAVTGAAVGAAAGAVLGAILGDAGSGAAIGAATGGVGNAISRGEEAELQYKRAFINCMAGRGHRVIN